ncbi:MAG: hypothetical protein ACE5KM_06625 [Planctomycetaceae bacterium]
MIRTPRPGAAILFDPSGYPEKAPKCSEDTSGSMFSIERPKER